METLLVAAANIEQPYATEGGGGGGGGGYGGREGLVLR